MNIKRSDNEITIGNPELKPTVSYNFDLSADYYFRSIGLISAGIFYKKIDDFIVDQVSTNYEYQGNTYTRFTQPKNAGNANLVGVELSYQRDFSFIAPALKCVGFYGTYTYTHSRVEDFNFEGRENEKDLSTGNVGYNLPSHTDDGYLRIERDIIEAAYKQEYDSYDAMLTAYNGMGDGDKKSTIFIVGKRYYINYNENDKNTLREVNLYADLIRDPESSDVETSLGIVPAKIIQFNVGVYGSVADYDLSRPYTSMVLNIPAVGYQATVAKQERFNVQEAINGDVELKEKQEKNGHMEVAVNTGKFNRQNVTYSGQTHAYDYAYPFTDYQQKTEAQLTDFLPYSLSLNDVCPDSVGHRLSTLSLFHSNIPYTIQFQANKLPDVNKVFLIGNKQYLCEKIETEIDVDGLSKVLKGTFYRIE